MRIADIVALLKAEVLAGHSKMGLNIAAALGTDLLSEVLVAPRDETVLLTGLTNVQVVRTAGLLEIRAVVLARGKRPDPETLRLAEETDLPLIATEHTLFESCGILYQAGLRA